jgi:L-asparaginase
MASTPSSAGTVVILGTGGTIAGTAASATDVVGYTAAQRGVEELVAAVPALATQAIECEQVAQLDSKDMDHATWQRLAQRAAHHLARPEVAGVVVTHGTDTLEETAYFLHRVLMPAKPLVLTAAMRPATALSADGPANLADAVTLARHEGAHGTLVVARIDNGRVRSLRPWPAGEPLGLSSIARDVATWPRVAIVASHAGASGFEVDVLADAGARGLVVAATGNGSLHHALAAALDRARAAGVRVLVATRCALGRLVDVEGAGALTPAQARVQLLLELLSEGA